MRRHSCSCGESRLSRSRQLLFVCCVLDCDGLLHAGRRVRAVQRCDCIRCAGGRLEAKHCNAPRLTGEAIQQQPTVTDATEGGEQRLHIRLAPTDGQTADVEIGGRRSRRH